MSPKILPLSKDEHLQKAVTINSFRVDLEANLPNYREWIVVGLFYTVLHFIDAIQYRNALIPGDICSHADRDAFITRMLVVNKGDKPPSETLIIDGDFYKDYLILKSNAYKARYDKVGKIGKSELMNSLAAFKALYAKFQYTGLAK